MLLKDDATATPPKSGPHSLPPRPNFILKTSPVLFRHIRYMIQLE
jgi:hypothetical protein